MRWDVILPGLSALLGKLTGLQVFEENSPQKATNAQLKAKLTFKVSSCVGLGEDEWRYTQHGAGPDQDLTICGTRQFTLSVICEGYDAKATSAAYWYLERIYTRLSRPASNAALLALGVSWVDAGPFHNLSRPMGEGDRVFSIGQKDLMFTAVVNDSDDDPADFPITTIAEVQLYSNTLNGADGVPLTKQIAFTGP